MHNILLIVVTHIKIVNETIFQLLIFLMKIRHKIPLHNNVNHISQRNTVIMTGKLLCILPEYIMLYKCAVFTTKNVVIMI